MQYGNIACLPRYEIITCAAWPGGFRASCPDGIRTFLLSPAKRLPTVYMRHNAAPGCLAVYRPAQKSRGRQGGGQTALPAALAGNNRRFYR